MPGKLSYIVLLMCLGCSLPLAAQDNGGGVVPPAGKPFVVVIDPGHGGSDPGARGRYSTEKEVALGVALKLGKMIDALPNVKVVYTRVRDELAGGGTNKKASLYHIADFANQMGGNVFISIHCNSVAPTRHRVRTGYRKSHGRRVPVYKYTYTPNNAQGTEVYVWGVSRNDDKDVALRENAPLLNDPEYKNLFDSSDSPASTIFWNTVRREYMNQSLDLAAKVEDEFTKVGRVNRQVKQRGAPIWVLHATAMPSILVETGFISNPEEENYLNNHQDEIAACIYKAFVRYLAEIRAVTPDQLAKGMDNNRTRTAPVNLDYKIQLLASESKLAADDPRFSKLDDPISVETLGDNRNRTYRYLMGEYKDYDQASRKLDRIKLMGYRDAFIVSYKDGQRIDE